MGKWITRCLEKNTDHIPIYDTDNTDSLNKDLENYPMSTVSHSPVLENLTESERQAYLGWHGVMIGEKFNMTEEEAHEKSMQLLVKTSRLLKIEQAVKDYQKHGFIKIFSSKLNRNIYLAENERIKKRVPDQNLQVFLESEIEALKGLSHDEQLLLLEAKTLLNFNGSIVDGGHVKNKQSTGRKSK